MPRSDKKHPGQPARMRWRFERDIPTEDLLAGLSLDDTWGLQEAVEVFIGMLEHRRFLAWEAVVCQEQGLPLTARQKKALAELINFDDPDDARVLYIDGIPRPSEPWRASLNRIAPHLLIEPFRTFDVHDEVKAEGWERIMAALEKHGQGLSLPPGATSCRKIVPADPRHKLWLQYCFDVLSGLGQSDYIYLEETPWRVDEFIARLRECRGNVVHLRLTLESLLTRVILPERDRPLFLKLMRKKLDLGSTQESLAGHL